MPAEWTAQEAVWYSWPVREKTWPNCFGPIPDVFATILSAASHYQAVRVNAALPLHEDILKRLQRAKADLSRVTLFDHPTNDAWCRDHGPIFVRHAKTGQVAITDWQFNSWGGKYLPYDADNAIPSRIAKALGMERFEVDIILEGGSIDVNGDGVVLTTEACLLNPNRNPHLSRAQIEQKLKENLGLHTVLWLGDGIVGDDTDGHVDDLTRFFKSDGIVTAVESNPKDVNYRALQENLERLKTFRQANGKPYEIVELPMPKPCVAGDLRLPASYANFLVINGAVLMPAFRQPKRDAEAAEILAHCFPGRDIVPLDCLDLVRGLGTLHCISQQQPA